MGMGTFEKKKQDLPQSHRDTEFGNKNYKKRWSCADRGSDCATLAYPCSCETPVRFFSVTLCLCGRFGFQINAPGRAPRVLPSPEPSELKKPPWLREALARAFSSSAGMPRVRASRLLSVP